MPASTVDFRQLLAALVENGVDFVVVGGVCAVLHGAPITTFDLDIVHSRDPANVDRLLEALRRLNAYYRHQPEKRLRPDRSHLESPGHQLLATDLGPLDVLGAIGSGRTFSQLAERVEEVEVGGMRVRILDLECLLQVKEETAQDKDLPTLEILRQILNERRGR